MNLIMKTLLQHTFIVILTVSTAFFIFFTSLARNSDQTKPNIIIIFTDDQGYGDLASYGNTELNTPHTDRMAEEGMRFTDFYVAAGVCTPSRAALLTGSYPKRVGLAHRVLFPYSDTGLNTDEITIADMLKDKGYATAIIGKWHLGHHTPFLPTRQGFDYYFGIPYSNDMAHLNYQIADDFLVGPLPLFRNEHVIETDPDQRFLTSRFTEEAVNFITTHKDEPFFVYLPHVMPHVPIASSYHFTGKSEYGLYGDTIEEIDWSVGRILDHVENLGLDDNTIVIFTSDNGAQVWEGEGGWVWTPDRIGRPTRGEITYQHGSNGPLRGAKNSTWEGGMRVPFIIRWPGQIPAGSVSNELTTAMDLFPTIARIVGAELPDDRIIDGHDIWPILSGETNAQSPYEAFYYYRDDRLQAVRSGKWKLHIYRPGEGRTQILYDLEADIGETTDVSEQNPDVVNRLEELAEKAREDMGDDVTGHEGNNLRPIGTLK
ncbi:MAG: arylsulfatase [Balneolaceae bacterium]|nr:MAG: arylsulfatase [Balneolaceae bacterium]